MAGTQATFNRLGMYLFQNKGFPKERCPRLIKSRCLKKVYLSLCLVREEGASQEAYLKIMYLLLGSIFKGVLKKMSNMRRVMRLENLKTESLKFFLFGELFVSKRGEFKKQQGFSSLNVILPILLLNSSNLKMEPDHLLSIINEPYLLIIR